MEKKKETSSLLILSFVAVATAFALYGIFYHFSQSIWNSNQRTSLSVLAPATRRVSELRDGMETYALYLLALADLVIVALLAKLAERLPIGKRRRVFWPAFALVSLVLVACFGRLIGFHPPRAEIGSPGIMILVVAAVALFLWSIVKISGRHRRLADLLIVLGLLPVCFVATGPIHVLDYAYVFSPALRLVDHFKLSEIYFQYDLLLSLIAAAWLKLKLDLNLFQVVAQASTYAFLLGCLFCSRRFFLTKKLSYYLLAAVVLVRVYALIHDSAALFQVTPLRLDLWIILFVIAYEKGIYSKWLGAALGFLVVFHSAFGVIYGLGYLELVATLWLLDCLGRPVSWCALKEGVRKHAALAWPDILFLLASLACSYALFRGSFLEASSTYRRVGIGFMRTDPHSFYWYVLVMLALAFALLIRRRAQLGEKYFHGGLFLILLAVGNSLYFFGRSDEHNIIDISASLLFVLFLLLDLVFSEGGGPARSRGRKILVTTLAVSLVLGIAFCYSGRIKVKVVTQYQNLMRGQLIYPLPIQVGPNVLLPVVGDSQKVYFMTGCDDFYYYYYWNYVPQGHFLPYCSWVYERDLVNFVQGLIYDHYYVAIRETDVVDSPSGAPGEQETLGELKYAHLVRQDGWRIMWESPGNPSPKPR
jgi:hypothetical protein